MEISREDLIALCERGRVPEKKWLNRDSASAQRQMGEAWALLSAGCEFAILHEGKGRLESDENTWWVQIWSEGFNFHEGGFDGDEVERLTARDSDHYYIPTAARLDRNVDSDWY